MEKPAKYAAERKANDPPDRYLYHVNLTTGRTRRSWPREVEADNLERLRPLLAAALDYPQPVPGMPPGCTLEVLRSSKCLLVLLRGPADAGENEGPRLATIGVARHSRCAPSLWESLIDTKEPTVTSAATRPTATPWCALRLESATALYAADHPIMAAIERFELELSWTFLDERA